MFYSWLYTYNILIHMECWWANPVLSGWLGVGSTTSAVIGWRLPATWPMIGQLLVTMWISAGSRLVYGLITFSHGISFTGSPYQANIYPLMNTSSLNNHQLETIFSRPLLVQGWGLSLSTDIQCFPNSFKYSTINMISIIFLLKWPSPVTRTWLIYSSCLLL